MQLYPSKVLPSDWDQFFDEQRHGTLPGCLQVFYGQPLIGRDQKIESTDFVAVDIESTGLDAEADDIVSIGIVPFDSKKIYLSQARHWLTRTRQLTDDSVIVHHITHSEVADAPGLAAVLPEVMASLAGKQIVVHYRYMEREFFRQAVISLFEQNWLFPVIDTLELEVRQAQRKQAWLDKALRKAHPSMRLPDVRERYHLPAYENHNALVDALATAELWQAQVSHWNIGKTDVRRWWS
ncbi:MAG: 3'-5' exonuclease [Reinekea sp.]